MAKAIRLAGALLLLTAASGCGKAWSPVEAVSPNELFALKETKRYASLHRWFEVRGAISAEPYLVPKGAYSCTDPLGCVVAAWYQSGIVFFYQTLTNKYTQDIISDIANHEVCHHDYPQHDLAHWKCTVEFGNPTYPQPKASEPWTGEGFAFLHEVHERMRDE